MYLIIFIFEAMLKLSTTLISCILFLNACQENSKIRVEQVETILVETLGPPVRFHDDHIKIIEDLVFYNDAPLSAELQENWKSGNLKSLKQYRNGKLHGFAKSYFENGNLQSHYNFIEGREHGLQKGNHFSGNISYEYNSLHGDRVGWYTEYFPNGELQIKNYYQKGKLVKSKVQSPDGKVMVNYEIKDGRYYGLLGSSQCVSVLNENQKLISDSEK